jgi:hypothetical protein
MAVYTAIDNPELYFQVKTYTGNGSDDNAITFDNTDTNMSPNIVWMKSTSNTGYNHFLVDSVRGVTKAIRPNLYNDEDTYADAFKSFDSNGFTLDDDGSNGEVNVNTQTYAAWCWKAGTAGSGTTTGAGTGQAYTYSVDTTSGVSIMAYTGNGTANHTIPHNLGVVPKMFMVKIRTGDNNNWGVFHHKSNASPEQFALYLDSNHAATDDIFMNDVAPTSSAINLSGGNYGNVNTNTYVAYCFAEKQGFSKFGSYTGNGNADGAFVYTGFRPAFTLIKPTSITGDWRMHDNKRNSYNVLTQTLKPNSNDADDTTAGGLLDYTATGFKWRTSSTYSNGAGVSFIYMCFAEAPFVNSNGVPCNAR